MASCAILVVLYRKTPFHEVYGALSQADVQLVLLACAMICVVPIITGRRLRILTSRQGFRLRTSKLMQINLTSQLYKSVLPGGLVTGHIWSDKELLTTIVAPNT